MNEPRAPKRSRSISSSSTSSDCVSERSRSSTPPPKYHRSNSLAQGSRAFICTLPPTCSQPSTSTSYDTQEELDRHQESFHKWICRVPIRNRDASATVVSVDSARIPEGFVGGGGYGKKAWKECGKVFPSERFLDLHHIETHDPISRERKNRGEKIFQCFLPPEECSKVFLIPSARRKHLIAKHKYPHGFFFSITNHGLNQIAQEDGLAISLIRPRKEGPANDPKAGATPTNTHGEADPDIAMDELTTTMAGLQSSLDFVPRGVRKQKKVVRG